MLLQIVKSIYAASRSSGIAGRLVTGRQELEQLTGDLAVLPTDIVDTEIPQMK